MKLVSNPCITTVEQEALGFIRGILQMRSLGIDRVSPLIISTNPLDGLYGGLDFSLKLWDVRTAPYFDIENSISIAMGKVKPQFVTLTRQTARINFCAQDRAGQKRILDMERRIRATCRDALYQQLFGAGINYFERPIDWCKMEISGLPVGNVTMHATTPYGDWAECTADFHRVIRRISYACPHAEMKFRPQKAVVIV